MSKEFEEWWGNEDRRWDDEKETAKAAFTAGRALGRREHPTWEYERPCAICGTPMFSSEPIAEGEVHGICAIARKVGRREMKGEVMEAVCGVFCHAIFSSTFHMGHDNCKNGVLDAIEAMPEEV